MIIADGDGLVIDLSLKTAPYLEWAVAHFNLWPYYHHIIGIGRILTNPPSHTTRSAVRDHYRHRPLHHLLG
jgi:hypothetical protein